jgi:Flp pilus assembly pilin Flp
MRKVDRFVRDESGANTFKYAGLGSRLAVLLVPAGGRRARLSPYLSELGGARR